MGSKAAAKESVILKDAFVDSSAASVRLDPIVLLSSLAAAGSTRSQ